VPVGVNEGAKGDQELGDPVIVIEFSEDQVSDHERSTIGWPYREWCLPVALVNRQSRRVIHQPDDDGIATTVDWWEERAAL
jgi:hypothetical protein